tara:strand:+ start:2199 stop:2816 length:618 start_codon:yes stop_codon:yes gene_type:complete
MRYINDKKQLKTFFNKSYYNSINYLNYPLREKKYHNTSKDIINFFKLNPNDLLLDYGCAIGLLLRGYNSEGFNKVWGYDISNWAINESKNITSNTSSNIEILNDKTYKLTTALDVFEHMFDEDLDDILKKISTQTLVLRIPVKLKGDNDFYLEVSRKDKSHVNCKTQEEWISFIEGYGFNFKSSLNLPHIYNSKGCFCGYFIKKS